MAAPRPAGTDSTAASSVTDAVPAMSASAPYWARMRESGRQLMLVKNSQRSSFPKRNGAPSRKTKKKIAKTKKMALQPHRRIVHSIDRFGERPDPRLQCVPHRHRATSCPSGAGT